MKNIYEAICYYKTRPTFYSFNVPDARAENLPAEMNMNECVWVQCVCVCVCVCASVQHIEHVPCPLLSISVRLSSTQTLICYRSHWTDCWLASVNVVG